MTTLLANSRKVQFSGKHKQITANAHFRLMMLLLVFLAGFTVVVGRLISFSIIEDAQPNRISSATYVPARGDIMDRNGVALARTMQGYAIRVVPERVLGDKELLANQLAALFPDTSREQFRSRLNGSRPTYLRRRALPSEVKQVHALGEIGIEFPRENERLYPQRELAAHILGYVDADNHGIMGMERVLNDRLTDESHRSEPAVLSIDSRVQAAFESELSSAMISQSAKGAAGIILDVQTGEVMALASLPMFDPNKIRSETMKHQVNEVTQSVFELGSTFKPFTIAAALDAGTVTDLAVRYNAMEPIKVGGFTIKDDHSQGRYLNVPETLVHSSNIVTARIADNLGKEGMEHMIRSLGFDERPHIELAERGHPLWPKSWGRVTNMTIAYGHGIAVTPLHLASAYAALVNGGIWRPATLLKVEPGKESEGRRVFKAATSARMRQLLRMIVSSGTGRKADAPGYRVGGKTGSAEKPSAGGYNKTSLVSTFAAAFPMDNPRYVIIAMLDEPQGNAESAGQRTAGWTAAPIVSKVVTRVGPMLGVVPDEHRDVDVSELTPLLWAPKG
ncbi:peptidoglycan D,D-transpeptidase FtsI family protein [Parasphingorhabdus halotolerans]|uniref:Penicillin-binding protein 2 n=1 Tax=Parasphingorhabdus halotolerans TaxID=2725558 RepID=A0A6H2DLM0_9SPHN|nr:penicillin-binding protein 2 [Parasphingorhabdus halotolerans]QJB69027.1 penicillin-binding protein 2 [Parasphingorhabdus halotolerans]